MNERDVFSSAGKNNTNVTGTPLTMVSAGKKNYIARFAGIGVYGSANVGPACGSPWNRNIEMAEDIINEARAVKTFFGAGLGPFVPDADLLLRKIKKAIVHRIACKCNIQ